MTESARQQLADALRSAKKGKGRYPVAPKEQRTVDGKVFASKREAARYAELRLLEQQKLISHLECQPTFKVTINGHPLCRYTADFQYFRDGELTVEDVKSSGTRKDPYYRLRKRAAELWFFIKVREV